MANQDFIKATLRSNYPADSNNDSEMLFWIDNAATADGQAYNNAKKAWLNDNKGVAGVSLVDNDTAYLKSLGYTGTLQDMLYQALVAGTYYTT